MLLSLRSARFHSILLFVIILVTPFYTSIAAQSGKVSGEYALKAVCLYNFTQFTTWPSDKELKKSESLVISIVGVSPFGGMIDQLQERLNKTGRTKVIVKYHGPYHEELDLRGSHLLFIGASEKPKMKTIVESLHNEPMLTVSDAGGFLDAGGMISLVLVKNKVRWVINRPAIQSAGLQVSAKLLQLAIKIEDIPGNSDLFHFKRYENDMLAYSPGPFTFRVQLAGSTFVGSADNVRQFKGQG